VALQHLGLIIQPSFLVAEELRSGALVEVMPQYRSLEFDISAVYPSRKHVLPKVRLLIDYLAAALKKKSWPD
jgi:DNA-binding transcriptional LysR family regulator